MEKLKKAIPESLKLMIGDGHTDDLPLTCSCLLDFLLHFQPFHQMVKDLAEPDRSLCVKNKDVALHWKQKGNRCFSSGDFANALDSYSQALRLAPIDADDMDKNMVATLFVNRASTLHKMDLLTESLRDCNRALQISPSYAKAWYRRGKVNATLRKYEDASRDLDVAKVMESSLGGKQQIESEQKSVSNEYHSKISPRIQETENKLNILGQLQQINLQAVNVPHKGKGVVSTADIPCSSLVHAEEPFAMIILKQCRETHCHYCLNELPPDKVCCVSCSRPWYCSQQCQLRAGGRLSQTYQKNYGTHENLPHSLEKYVEEISLGSDCEVDIDQLYEHQHECQGVNWPAILPPEIVLAGRVLVKSVTKRTCLDVVNTGGMLELCHHYSKMSSESKLELHIYSTVLLFCLQHSNGLEIQINGESIAQIVIIVSQIRVNSMTIVRMRSLDSHEQVSQFGKLSLGALTSNMKQVKAGQAIYKFGSLFNHSCQPNVHAYFLSRTLFIRTTEFVATGCPLELSYGPQVGQWDCKDRIKFLEDEYSFQCHCCCCSNINLSDLVLNAFRCVEPKCLGIVLDSCIFNCEKQKMKRCTRITGTSSLGSRSKVDNVKDDIFKMVRDAFLQSNASFNISPGYCFKCGSYRNIESSNGVVNKVWMHIRRLQEGIMSEEISHTILSDALRSLELLRSTLHPYNRRIAEAEDILAQAFCSVGEFRPALDHCKASIEILEKLYHPNHIVIGHELVKLASIQISLVDCTTVDNISRLNEIFSCYYGSHADMIFLNLQHLSREAWQLCEVTSSNSRNGIAR